MNQLPDEDEPRAKVDLARLALRRAQQDARRGRFLPSSRPRTTTPRRRRSRPEPVVLRAALDELITQKTGLSSTAATVLMQWPSMVGPEVARHVAAVDFDTDARALVLRPDSVAWATQIRLLAPQLIRRLNADHNSETVRTVRILKPVRAQLRSSAKAPPAVSVVPPPSPEPVPGPQRPLYRRPPVPRPVDPAVLAAAERQAQQTPREPEHLLHGPRSTPASPADRTRARALLRARARRQPPE
ncbi:MULTISPECIES: DUF721 domain-containing protein [Streptomyces]|uniref:Nucleic acid-binding Zn ribbon protein n=1 Tax=Streptomyces demainii TaxID=588122 RepID=A0ABT9KJS0_9ACTN|nr:DUF721 domain-containing protein [Streptomyces demainii]MDP9607807.1 putative nucleic acid-binding Zn ribbon protein [Streptomyces demainii]